VTSNNIPHHVDHPPPPGDQDDPHTIILNNSERQDQVFNPDRWKLDLKIRLNGLDPCIFDQANPGDICLRYDCINDTHHPNSCPYKKGSFSQSCVEEMDLVPDLDWGGSDDDDASHIKPRRLCLMDGSAEEPISHSVEDPDGPYAAMVSPDSTDESKAFISRLDNLTKHEQVQTIENIFREKDRALAICKNDVQNKRKHISALEAQLKLAQEFTLLHRDCAKHMLVANTSAEIYGSHQYCGSKQALVTRSYVSIEQRIKPQRQTMNFLTSGLRTITTGNQFAPIVLSILMGLAREISLPLTHPRSQHFAGCPSFDLLLAGRGAKYRRLAL
ncbi:Hypothetical predicted protein, partial [Olea europaea subsp. europaea]